jgi:hypothetical protein
MKHPNQWPRQATILWKFNWRKNPNLKFVTFFAAVILLFSTLKHFEHSPTKKTSWHTTQWQLPHTDSDRTPASGDECLPHTPKLVELQKENIKLNHLKNHSIKGFWLHLNLAKLSFAEARFLSFFPASPFLPIADQLKVCLNIPCLFNQLSQDISGEYGELAWNFYLKSGIAIQWKDGENSFNKNELQLLWQLTSQLPSSFLHQSELRKMSKSPLREGICFNTSNSEVELSTQCLNNEASPVETKKIIVAGMSHALHSKLKPTEQEYFTWQNKTWKKTELERTFFAQQVAQYIVQFEATPDLQTYFRDTLFKRDWSLAGEMHRMFKKDQWVWRDIRNRHLNDCLDLHKSALFEKKSLRGIASLSVPHPIAVCLRETAAQAFLKNRRQWLSQENPRQCEWMSSLASGAVPVEEYVNHWEKLLARDIDQLEWRMRADGPKWLLQHIKKEAVLAKMDPTWVYFQCHDSPNPKGCYEQGLTGLVREQERGPASEKEEWLNDYPFESLEERVSEDVGIKRQWFLSHIEEEAEKAWSSCWRQGPNEMVLLKTSPQWISSGVEYVDGKFVSCLESASSKLMSHIIQDNSPESQFWKNELKSPLRDWWKKKIQAEANKERSWLLLQSEQIKSNLSHDLINQMKGQQNFSANAQCLNRLSYHYPTRMYFHERRQLNQNFGVRLCKEVLATVSMKKAVSSYKKMRWNNFGNELTSQLLTRWEDRTRRFCFGRIPAQEIRDLIDTEKMKGCMREQFDLSWPEASTEVTQKFSLPEDSLDEFKDEVITIAEASLLKQFQK